MPVTRAQKRTDSVGGDKGRSAARHRNAARAKSRDVGGQVQAAAASDDNDNDEVYFDDEEPDIGKTLHAKDGKEIVKKAAKNTNMSFTHHFNFH